MIRPVEGETSQELDESWEGSYNVPKGPPVQKAFQDNADSSDRGTRSVAKICMGVDVPPLSYYGATLLNPT